MTVADLTLAAVLAAIVVVLVAGATTYNRLVRSRNRVREAWSGIDVQLKRRTSLIPNVLESVRGYAAHERGVFDEVTRARSALQQAGGAPAAADANNALTQGLSRLLAVAEAYPELRASASFGGLQQELADVEQKISFARDFYNRNVLDYNTRVQSFPGVIVARTFTFDPADFFDAGETGRAEVPVSFAGPSVPSASPPAPPPPPPNR